MVVLGERTFSYEQGIPVHRAIRFKSVELAALLLFANSMPPSSSLLIKYSGVSLPHESTQAKTIQPFKEGVYGNGDVSTRSACQHVPIAAQTL